MVRGWEFWGYGFLGFRESSQHFLRRAAARTQALSSVQTIHGISFLNLRKFIYPEGVCAERSIDVLTL